MPHLDAKALETDPDGMALLRAAIAPRPAAQATGLPVRPIREATPASAPVPVRIRSQRRQVRLACPVAVA